MSTEANSGGTRSLLGPAAGVWRHTLSRIPTLFGKLVYVASLHKQDSGLYEHDRLSQMLGKERADQTLRESHMEVFRDWLCLTLERQKADLAEYLAGLPVVSRDNRDPLHLGSYVDLTPDTARSVERELYLMDLQTLLELLRHGYDAACPQLES
jgi:hypothetical protein